MWELRDAMDTFNHVNSFVEVTKFKTRILVRAKVTTGGTWFDILHSDVFNKILGMVKQVCALPAHCLTRP